MNEGLNRGGTGEIGGGDVGTTQQVDNAHAVLVGCIATQIQGTVRHIERRNAVTVDAVETRCRKIDTIKC